MIVIETGCHIEAPRDVVAERIRSLVEERQLDDVDRAWGRFMGADAEADGADYSVTAVGDATYRVSFREPPFAGIALFELESVDAGVSTVVEVRVELEQAPLAVRVLARVPGTRGAARRVVQMSLADWLGEPDVAAPAPAPPIIPHDPTRPGWDEPEVRRAVHRSVGLIALGWALVAALAMLAGVVIASFVATEERLEREGTRVEVTVDEFREDDGDGAWVSVAGTLDGAEVRHSQLVGRVYRVGETVVLHHDLASGLSKLADEAYEPDHDYLGYGPAIAAFVGAVLLFEPTYRARRSRVLLRRAPFVQVEIGLRPPVARSHGAMVVVFGPGDHVRVFGAPIVAWPGRTERVLDELETGCLMAGTGRDRVLWKPRLGRVVRIAESRFAWRNARWRRR